MCEGAMCQDEVVDVKDDAWGGWSPEGGPAWFDQPAPLVPKEAGLPEKARLRAKAKAHREAAEAARRASMQRIEAVGLAKG